MRRPLVALVCMTAVLVGPIGVGGSPRPAEAATSTASSPVVGEVHLTGTLQRLVTDRSDGSGLETLLLDTGSAIYALPDGAVPIEARSGARIDVVGVVATVGGGQSFTSATVTLLDTFAAAAATTGPHRVLVITANSATPLPATIDSTMVSTNAFYQEVSYGQSSITGNPTSGPVDKIAVSFPFTTPPDPTPPTPPGTAWTCSNQNLFEYHRLASLAAAAAGFPPANYDSVVVTSDDFHSPTTDCNFAGLAEVSGTRVWIPDTAFDLRALSHEIGHNFGFSHANAANCVASTGPSVPAMNGTCVPPDLNNSNNVQYGDPFSSMGASFLGIGGFSSVERSIAGWLNATRLKTVTASGTWTLAPIEQSSAALQALRITLPNGQRLWFEYRASNVGTIDTFINTNPLHGNGVQVRAEPMIGSGFVAGAYLLDATPTAAGPNWSTGGDFADAPIVAGATANPADLVSVSVPTISAGVGAQISITLHPGAPTITGVSPSDRSLTVAIADPAQLWNKPIATYRVHAVPPGGSGLATIDATSSTGAVNVDGLTNGVTYTLTAQVSTSDGTSAASAPATGSASATVGTVTALAPMRVSDTRDTNTPMAGGSTRRIDLAPFIGSTPGTYRAAAVNLTVTGSTMDGYLTAFPCGQAVPNTSNVNFARGSTAANSATVDLDAANGICLFASGSAQGSVQVIVDLTALYNGLAGTAGGRYHALAAPQRFVDTRGGPLVAGTPMPVLVAGRLGVPPGATAVTVNATVTEPTADGYIRVFPCGTEPSTSTVNFVKGETVPNSITVGIGTGGSVCVSAQVPTHVVLDVSGWFDADPNGASYHGVNPDRLIDTRTITSPVGTGQVMAVAVSGRSGVPVGATGAVLNVTVTNPVAGGFVTVFPCGQNTPDNSNVNYVTGQTISNGATVGLGGGTACVFAYRQTDVIVDVAGWFR